MSEFTYDRSWEEIYAKLRQCQKQQRHHLEAIKAAPKAKRTDEGVMWHMRQYKGLEGAICTLKWVMGDEDVDPLVGVLK